MTSGNNAQPATSSDAIRCFEGSQVRRRIMKVLARVGEAHLEFLAAMARTDPRSARWAMEGRLPYYAIELSPVALDFARKVQTRTGEAYRITQRGREAAKVAKRFER